MTEAQIYLAAEITTKTNFDVILHWPHPTQFFGQVLGKLC